MEDEERINRQKCFNQNRYLYERSELVSQNLSLIDFGSSYRYRDDEGGHIKDSNSEIGCDRNLVFVSKNHFNGTTLTRRDDIISIVYNLIYLMNPHDFRMQSIVANNMQHEVAYQKLK